MFGEHLVIDIENCQKDTYTNPEYLSKWVKSLVDEIEMVAYGEPNIVHFGKHDPSLAGWTVVQLIETSNIVAHFNDFDGTACIDVFSCKPFDPIKVFEHLHKWFKCNIVNTLMIERLPGRPSIKLEDKFQKFA